VIDVRAWQAIRWVAAAGAGRGCTTLDGPVAVKADCLRDRSPTSDNP